MDYFLAFSTPPSTYGSGAGTKIEKISELFSPFMQIIFIFEVIKWQWITSQENQVETVQINSATQWTCEVTAYWHCTRKDQIQSIFWWKMSNITTHTKKGHVARILLIAGCFCLNGTRAYEWGPMNGPWVIDNWESWPSLRRQKHIRYM